MLVFLSVLPCFLSVHAELSPGGILTTEKKSPKLCKRLQLGVCSLLTTVLALMNSKHL